MTTPRKEAPRKKMTTSQDMMQVQRDLGRIMESLNNGEIHRKEMVIRIDKLSDRIDTTNEKIDALSSGTAKMDQSLQSLSKITNQIALEKCGERLDKLEDVVVDRCDERLRKVEDLTKDLPEMMFWHRVVGTGLKASIRVGGVLLASGAVGGLVVKLLSNWLHWP